MQLDSLYQEIILDHYKHPHGKGLREPYDAEVYHVNPVCGDEVTLRVRLAADGTVEELSYASEGCAISQASASVLYDLVQGQSVDDAMKIHDAFLGLMRSQGEDPGDEELLGDGVAFAGVSKYPVRVKCALLAWMAWQDATQQALAKADGAGHPVVARPQGEYPSDSEV